VKLALFYYDGFGEFEIVLTCLLFRRHELIAIALENREYRSEERQRFCVDQIVRDVDAYSIDLLVIPGGDPTPLIKNEELKGFIEKLVAGNKKIGAICGGSELLAAYGILNGKHCTGGGSGVGPDSNFYPYYTGAVLSEEHVVVDGNIITAQGQAFVEFAVELARQMGLYEREEEYEEVLSWFKNVR